VKNNFVVKRDFIMPIKASSDLVTSRQETRAGFIEFVLEKNRRSKPYIESAKAFRHFAAQAKVPADLLKIKEIREPLATASGMSDKSLKYFSDEDIIDAVNALIKNFLEPSGDEFVDEAVYRFLLMKGDALCSSMRNAIGALAQRKLIRSLLSVMSVIGMDYKWLSASNNSWFVKPSDDYEIENGMKAISWQTNHGTRTFAFNLNIPVIGKNIDLCLFDCSPESYGNGSIVSDLKAPIMFGELKGGIDPAGADEHWKTANATLGIIKTSFEAKGRTVLTSFVGAAIEVSMAEEIFAQLKSGTIAYAANLTKSEQLIEYCNWLISL
jgi:type II restriction enzyme